MSRTAELVALESWLKGTPGGFIHPSLQLVNSGSRGVHWRAVSTIDAEAKLIVVPHSLAFSYLNALVDDKYPVFRTRRKDFAVEAIGFFYLMIQYIDRAKSVWKPYLDTLPRPDEQFTSPLWFDDPHDEAWLADTDVHHSAKQRDKIYQEYFQSGTAILKEVGIDVSGFSWDLFRWAITMFTSRSFSSRAIAPQDSKYWTTYKTGPDGRRQTALMNMSHTHAEDLDFSVLFPIMDSGNHNPLAKVLWNFEPGRFYLSTTEALAGDREICNNYGPKGNDELLMGYGFCIDRNPYDTVRLTLKAPPVAFQETLRQSHPGYFTPEGEWDGLKATFKLHRLVDATAEPSIVFKELPEPLVDLLRHIIRHGCGLPFDPAAEHEGSASEIVDRDRRYRPAIARMLSQSLMQKVAIVKSTDPAFDPTRPRQVQARIYRESQVQIAAEYLNAFQSFLSALLSAGRHDTRPEVCLMPLEAAVQSFQVGSAPMMQEFLSGIEANANTSDIAQLRLAGWEEDVWVLLISYAWLWTRRHRDHGPLWDWMDGIDEVYLLGQSDFLDVGDFADQADGIMELVHTAAEALPHSLWTDRQWSTRLVAGVGGRVVKNESLTMPMLDNKLQQELTMVVHFYNPRA